MRRRKWRRAIWLWGLIALLLSADIYSTISATTGDGAKKTSAMPEELAKEKKAGSDRETALPKKEIALTFDDGPHPVYTPMLLDGLKARGVRVSFFLIGQNIDGNEDIIRRMKEDGHLIGNHSQSHMQL